jgi:hypothetical protein
LKPPGDYAVEIEFEKPEHPVAVDFWVGDQRRALTLSGGSGSSRLDAGVIKASQFQNQPFVMLKITPHAPFTKGAELGVKILQVSLQHP